MDKRIKLFLAVLLVFICVYVAKTEQSYAYTLEDLGSYIENPEWFENQIGRYADVVGTEQMCTELEVSARHIIYLNESNKTFQIYVRHYDEEKGIDIDAGDIAWEVLDERICTIDSNGLVTAGELTGITTIVLEYGNCFYGIPVYNVTGLQEEWYEDMFESTHIFYNRYKYANEGERSAARNCAEGLANAYKIIVDAYVEYGEGLRTDSKLRAELVENIAWVAFSFGANLYLQYHEELRIWGEYLCAMLEAFYDTDRPNSCAFFQSNPQYVYIYLDGAVYEAEFVISVFGRAYLDFSCKNKEATGSWDEDYFYYEESLYHFNERKWVTQIVPCSINKKTGKGISHQGWKLIQEKLYPYRPTVESEEQQGFGYIITDGAVYLDKVPETYSIIVIPEYVNGVRVTAIDENGFEYWNLTGVVIPESVTSIGDRAFFYCVMLESVVIPKSVTSIGQMAFLGCSSLKSVTIPESVVEIGGSTFNECPEDIVFYINKGSYAEEWLKKKGYEANIKYVD